MSQPNPALAAEGPDLTTLSWCVGEIREALARAESLLQQAMGSAPDDGSALRQARASVHQAQGALLMVDVVGVPVLTGEIEAVLDAAQRGELPVSGEVVSRLARAFGAINDYLVELLDGRPQQPLHLFPYLRALREMRGADRIHPGDLFVVDPSRVEVPPAARALRLDAAGARALRAGFERGLLASLRDPAGRAGADAMHAAIEQVAAAQAGQSSRAFWWAMQAFFDALRTGALLGDVWDKKLLARINLQLRKTLDEGAPVAERLLRDILFSVARAGDATPLVAQVREAWGLAGSVPADFEQPRYGRVDARAIRAMHDALARTRQSLDRWARGSEADRPAIAAALDELVTATAALPGTGLPELGAAFAELRRALTQDGHAPGDAPMLEAATSVLFAEQLAEHAALGDLSLAPRAQEMAARLHAALSAGSVPAPADEDTPGWLGELARAAQDRLTMVAFVGEVQANLRAAEKSLDAFFRDPALRAELPATAAAIGQVAGALRTLGRDDAAAACAHAAAQVGAWGHPQTGADAAAFERLAASLGAVGFFVEGLLSPDRARGRFAFDPATGEFRAVLGEAPAVALGAPVRVEVPEPAVDAVDPATGVAGSVPAGDGSATADAATPAPVATVESDLAAARAAGAAAHGAWRAGVTSARTALSDALHRIRDDATLLDDAPLRNGARRTIDLLETAQAGDAALLEALIALGVAVEQPAAAVEVPTDAAAIDTELLEVFLDEAGEVLAAIERACSALRSVPAPDALTAIRRGFHTLKGSSRMVGLERFGETAWAMERVLNLWLSDERAATPSLLDLIEDARALFGDWVAALHADPAAQRSSGALIAAADALREGRTLSPASPADITDVAVVIEDADVAAVADTADDLFEVIVASVPDEAEPDWHAPSELRDNDALLREAMHAAPVAEPTPPTESTASDATASDAAAVDSTAAPAAAPTPRADEVRVGDRTLSRALFDIFLGEADEIIGHLQRAFGRWASHPAEGCDARVARWMHSLVGSAGLVGIDPVHRIAAVLERFVLAQAAAGASAPVEDVAVAAHALARLQGMLHQFAAGREPRNEPETLAEAVALAERWEQRAATPRAILEQADLYGRLGPAAAVRESAAEAPLAEPEALDAELLPVFVEEAEDMLPAIGEQLRAWSLQPANPALPQQLMRALHTVKGSARMAGAMALGQGVHEMETSIEACIGAGQAPAELIDALIAEHDHVVSLFESIRGMVRVPAQTASGPAATPQAEAAAASPAVAAPQPMVRVRADVLDRMVNEAGEVAIARSRVESELGQLQSALGDLTENVARLRSQLREIEIQAETQIQTRIAREREHDVAFDPLEFDRYTRFQELTRMLAESVNDVATVQHNALRTLDAAQQDLMRQNRIVRELQQDLLRVRMVPFASLQERLFRVARQAAKELGKRVALDIVGGATEVDRGVLERMAGPLEHLLRNCVAHGIETREARHAAGKAEVGELRIEVRQEGSEVVLAIADDGGGLDQTRIRERALAQGLIAPDARLSPSELADLIFLPGFSTAASVNAIAGRGVGMDVVRSEVLSLGGRIATESAAGQGTTFTIHLPLTLAITQVVVVSAGEARFALPSASIEHVLQLRPEQLSAAYAERAVHWQGLSMPLHYLAGLLELDTGRPVAQHQSPVLVLRSGSTRIALHVDDVSRSQEVVVKAIGPQLSRLHGVSGATILGNGEILLILNPVLFAQREAAGAGGGGVPAQVLPAEPIRGPALVMVVDDSLTVRRATQRLLDREGFASITAKDGVDAMTLLQDHLPDVMLVDIEMPRMDGFDLTRAVRADPRLRAIPIVMITSRTADKHRNYALSLGVDAYMGKPYSDAALLENIRRLIAAREVVPAAFTV